ncbi:MAG: universal stress protein [Verrucomicrobia bacterium]|nr:universal stress protein [Verrucomicrobiota bacterium]
MPTDFSTASRQALPYALSLADQFGADLTLVHVVPETLPASISHIGIVLEEKRLIAAAKKALAQFREQELGTNLKVETVVLSGCPYLKLCEVARTLPCDLIITSTHGRTGLKHFLLGSTAERVVRFAPCPVLTVREQLIPMRFPETGSARFRRIIVPTDFSEASRKALPYAAAFAREFGAGIRVLHVIEPDAYYDSDGARSGVMEAHLKKALGVKLDLLLQSCAFEGTVQVRNGVAFEEIIHEAADQNADLIILSTHGRTGLKHVLLGSTTERVVRHAACPVLVVREQEHEFVRV